MEKRAGRPRSSEKKNEILKTAYEMLISEGYKAITMEGIAQRAGVSKTTIYKWWPTKAAVVSDAYFYIVSTTLRISDTGDVKKDIFEQAKQLAQFITSPRGRAITELIGEGQMDSEVADAYRTHYFSQRRQITHTILQKGIEKGQLRAETPLDLVTDAVFAPIFYRVMITGTPLEEGYIKQLVDLILAGFLKSNGEAVAK